MTDERSIEQILKDVQNSVWVAGDIQRLAAYVAKLERAELVIQVTVDKLRMDNNERRTALSDAQARVTSLEAELSTEIDLTLTQQAEGIEHARAMGVLEKRHREAVEATRKAETRVADIERSLRKSVCELADWFGWQNRNIGLVCDSDAALDWLEDSHAPRVADLERDNPWKPIPKGRPDIDGVRFLLGRPDVVGDRYGTIATGYWCEEYEFWSWPYCVRPTHCKQLAPFCVPDQRGEDKS